MARIIVALMAVLMLVGQAMAGQRVPIHVAEPSGVARQGWPVTSGIPFPQGVLREPVAVRLVDGAGKEMPLQTRVLGRWGDKSVRWLLLDFQVDLKANETFTGALEVGTAAAAVAQPVQATKHDDGSVQVDTGALAAKFDAAGKVTITQNGTTIFDSFCESRIELLEFSTFETAFGPSRGEFTFRADPGEVVVEEAGPLRCVVRMKGWHHTAEGKAFSPSTLRFEFYRRLPLVRVMHTFVMSENPNEVMIKRIELHSSLAQTPEAACSFGGTEQTDLTLKPGDAAYMLQRDVGELHYPHMNQRVPQYQIVRDLGWQDVLKEGDKSPGWMRISNGKTSATFTVPHMREQWPKSLRGEGGGTATVGLWPREYQPWDLRRVEVQYPMPGYFREYLEDADEARHWRGYMAGASMLKVSAMGLAKTHDVFCHVAIDAASQIAGGDLTAMAEKPLYAYVTSQWYCDSLALGRMWPHDAENFPKQEEHLTKWLEWIGEQQEKWKWYGILDWGDVQYVVRSPSYSKFPKDDRWWRHSGKYGWFNSGHSEAGGSLLEGLLSQWARTGDRRYLDLATARARHIMDVDTVHYYSDPDENIVGGMRRHGGFDHFAGNANPAGAHTVNNGLFEHYYLTGYQRAMDIAQLVSDAKAALPLSLSETRSGITDMNAYIYSYNLTHESRYLDLVKQYLANHAQRQTQKDWAKLWISYFTSPAREVLICGDKEVEDLVRQVYLMEYAALGSVGNVPEVALAYEMDPSEYNYSLVMRLLQRSAGGWPPTIMNSAGILHALPHLMWAVMDGRSKYGEPKAPANFGLAKGSTGVPIDLARLANANPWAVDVFDPSTRDTTQVALDDAGQGVYRFDFGPLTSWDHACIPVARSTPYPTRADAPKATARNLVGIPFGSRISPAGVPFDLPDPRTNGGKALLVLTAGASHEIAMPVGTRAVHVLGHISGRSEPGQIAGAEYEFLLTDGSVRKVPLVYMLDYEAVDSNRGVMNTKSAIGKLKQYVYRLADDDAADLAITSIRPRDLGKGHDLLIAAVTAEVAGPATVPPAPVKFEQAASDTLVYGMRGGINEHSNIGNDSRAQQGLAQIQATLPDWQTNRLLTDCLGVLEVLEPRFFIADVPNGEYEVTAWFAQPYAGCKNIFYVKAQDQYVFEKTISSYGVERGRMFPVTVTDGKFTLEIGVPADEFEKNAHWGIRAVEMRRKSVN